MDELNDADLIAKAKKGDAKAFEALVNNSYRTMFKIAFKYCGNQRDAEDITQDACIKLARGISKFKGDCAYTSWLYRLVINCAKDFYKKNNRHIPQEVEVEELATNNKADDALYTKQVIDAVHNLPEGEKEAVLLVHGEGLSHKEAAKALEVKESTISWRIHEARKKLSDQFERNQQHG